MPRPTYDPDYEYALSDQGDYVRVRIRRDRKRVLGFVVQYEATVGERRRPVVRYDCAHGRCHRDVMDARGRKVSVSPFAAELDR